MVVLAASVCSKSGKPLISRQFRPLPRSRVDALLASFPKLIPIGSQHTTVENNEVRFVYQPFDEVYVLLITNKASNILQDISTLNLIVRLISSLTPALNEPTILANSFELLGAFDEVVSLGYKENVNLQQVRNVLEGESHEEKIQEIIARNKEAEAKEELKRRAKQLEMQRREQQQRARANASGAGGYGGYGNGNGLGSGGMAGGYQPAPRFEPPPIERDPYSRTSSPAPAISKPAFKGSGMKLGKKGKQTDLLDALGGEAVVPQEEATPSAFTPRSSAPASPAPPASAAPSAALDVLPKVAQESIHVAIKEKLSLSLLRDGGVKSFELTGDLDLKITDPALARVKLALKPPSERAQGFGRELQFQQHPNVVKFTASGAQERVIALKDPSRSFPVGQGRGVLRWRLSTKDESLVPLSVNCWPTPRGDGNCDVNIEYELEAEFMTLRNVVISIPLPNGAYPSVSNFNGDWSVNPSNNTLQWTIDTIDAENRTGMLEFSSEAEDVGQYFPVQVGFVSAESLCEVEVESATLLTTGEESGFSQETVLLVDQYAIV